MAETEITHLIMRVGKLDNESRKSESLANKNQIAQEKLLQGGTSVLSPTVFQTFFSNNGVNIKRSKCADKRTED